MWHHRTNRYFSAGLIKVMGMLRRWIGLFRARIPNEVSHVRVVISRRMGQKGDGCEQGFRQIRF